MDRRASAAVPHTIAFPGAYTLVHREREISVSSFAGASAMPPVRFLIPEGPIHLQATLFSPSRFCAKEHPGPLGKVAQCRYRASTKMVSGAVILLIYSCDIP